MSRNRNRRETECHNACDTMPMVRLLFPDWRLRSWVFAIIVAAVIGERCPSGSINKDCYEIEISEAVRNPGSLALTTANCFAGSHGLLLANLASSSRSSERLKVVALSSSVGAASAWFCSGQPSAQSYQSHAYGDCGCGWPGRLALFLERSWSNKFVVHNEAKHGCGPECFLSELEESSSALKEPWIHAGLIILDFSVHMQREVCSPS